MQTIEVEEAQNTEVGDLVELDLKSVIGFSTSGTKKIREKLGEQEVIVLIDCGATHNSISQKLWGRLRITT